MLIHLESDKFNCLQDQNKSTAVVFDLKKKTVRKRKLCQNLCV